MVEIVADIKDAISAQRSNSFQISAGFWSAKVAKPVPVSEVQPLYVTIPSIDHKTKWKSIHWTPRSTQATINVAESPEAPHNINVMIRVLPALGDKALVAFDNNGN